MGKKHSQATVIHKVHEWEHADATARNAETVDSDDIGKVSWQQDTDVFYVWGGSGPGWLNLSGGQVGTLNQASHVDTTWYTVLTIPTTTDTALALIVSVSGHSDDVATAVWAYHMLAYAENDGGTLTTGNSTPDDIVEYDAAYDVRINTNGTDAEIQVRRNGGVDYDIDWKATAVY